MNKKKLVAFGAILKNRVLGAEVGGSSLMIAYYLLLSLFPLLIVVGNLLAFLGIDHHFALDYVAMVVPEAVMPVLSPLVGGLLSRGNGGLLSVGVLAAVWSSSRGVGYLQLAMDKAYGINQRSSYVAKRLLSLVTILLMLLLLVAFVLMFSVGDMVLQALDPHFPWAGNLLENLHNIKWPVTLFFLLALLTLVYWVTPDVKLRIRDALPGAVIGTLGLIALVQVFTIYVTFSARSLSGYGALSTFFVMMIWLKYTAVVVIFGAVINASIGEYRFGEVERGNSGLEDMLHRMRKNVVKAARHLLPSKHRNKAKEHDKQGEEPEERL